MINRALGIAIVACALVLSVGAVGLRLQEKAARIAHEQRLIDRMLSWSAIWGYGACRREDTLYYRGIVVSARLQARREAELTVNIQPDVGPLTQRGYAPLRGAHFSTSFTAHVPLQASDRTKLIKTLREAHVALTPRWPYCVDVVADGRMEFADVEALVRASSEDAGVQASYGAQLESAGWLETLWDGDVSHSP